MIKDIFYVELTKKDKMIYFLIGLLLILGFVFLISWIKWIILVFLLFLLGYQKKDFLFSKKLNLMDKMIAVDENNNMYILFNQKNGELFIAYFASLFFFFALSGKIDDYLLVYVSCLFIYVSEIIYLLNQKVYIQKKDLFQVDVANKRDMKVLKVLKVYSYSDDDYVLDVVSLRNLEVKKSLSVTFSKKYKNYQQLISLVNSFLESGSSFEK